MYRRSLLRLIAALPALPLRTARAASTGGKVPAEGTYVDLREVVSLPAGLVAVAWRPAGFNAFLADPRSLEADRMLKGILLRTGRDLQAFCIYCPHEVCMVQFRQDTGKLKLDKPREANHPLLVCPCHFSTFDPLQAGAPISGPAYRGLYRFRVMEDGANIHITGVEKGVLTLYR